MKSGYHHHLYQILSRNSAQSQSPSLCLHPSLSLYFALALKLCHSLSLCVCLSVCLSLPPPLSLSLSLSLFLPPSLPISLPSSHPLALALCFSLSLSIPLYLCLYRSHTQRDFKTRDQMFSEFYGGRIIALQSHMFRCFGSHGSGPRTHRHFLLSVGPAFHREKPACLCKCLFAHNAFEVIIVGEIIFMVQISKYP